MKFIVSHNVQQSVLNNMENAALEGFPGFYRAGGNCVGRVLQCAPWDLISVFLTLPVQSFCGGRYES